MGSKNPPCIVEPLSFSAQHGSKNPGFVLRPLSPYAVASLGVAYSPGKAYVLDMRPSPLLEGLFGDSGPTQPLFPPLSLYLSWFLSPSLSFPLSLFRFSFLSLFLPLSLPLFLGFLIALVSASQLAPI